MLNIDDFPQNTFILYSSSIKYSGFDLMNVTSSTGRADMIIRVLKNILFQPQGLNTNMGFLLFPNPSFLDDLSVSLNKENITQKGFLITFESPFFQNTPFREFSEHELLYTLYTSFEKIGENYENSLFMQEVSTDYYESLSSLVEMGMELYLLDEEGCPINKFNQRASSKAGFLLGDQIGYCDLDRDKLPKNVIPISLGPISFLGSTIVSLIKWILWEKRNQ